MAYQLFGDKLLTSYGVDPNSQDELGQSPLHEVCKAEYFDCLEDLLEAGADPAVTDAYGDTVMEKKSVVPNEKDFVDVDAILSLNEHQRRGLQVHKGCRITRIRQYYVHKVTIAEQCFVGKLCAVLNEFPCISQTDPSYTELLLLQPECICQNSRALAKIASATNMIHKISREYRRQLKEDGDSLDKCKRLKVAAFGCIFTVAKRSLPSLDYLHKLRQLMAAQAIEKKNLEDDESADATLTKNKYGILLQEYCPLALPVCVRDVADCVDPETFYWLDEMEREHGHRLEDDDQVDVAHKQEDHLPLPLAP